ncbi:iron-siderophore ABC transporter substrate-binding protein [Tessaracoccus sp. MC1679]|uniref:iron-siderophore ABC transporter substrate-binding protein n=1 Tax=Tessaracoccus sp. MC1679 TaxID=2760313 RepID=UPI0015FF3BD6|nr:iron-siderophore ABC transporter substrate-binding protein [Tessaracoccus sp. MC1679]MBB1514720.1 iron-siderophore ABC transporter substrate-binding protein [Tessaracoccus sp. MC1679]
MPLLSRVAGAVAAVLALSACSTGPSATTDGATSSATGPGSASTASDAFPVTVTHALGETVIEAEPTRIATIGWTDHETLVSLGVVPVGAVEITWGGNAEGSTDWFDEAVAELGGEQPSRYDDSAGAPIEEIVALEPDLILATNSGLTQEEYDTLSKVAPVVAYPEAAWSTSWQDSLELVGQAVGRSDRAAEVEAEMNALLEDAGAEYPEIAGTSAAWLWFAAADYSKFGLYTATDARPRFLDAVGFETPAIVSELSDGAPGQFSVDVSAERASEFDADVIVFYVDDSVKLEDLQAAPLIQDLPALKSGAFVASGDPELALPLSSPTPLSIPVAVEKFLPLLAEAAAKVQ